MKTAIYVRVSTEEQAKEGYSLKAQIDKLKSYIQIKDWDFYKVYADEGISGKNINDRPSLNELLNDIKDGNVNNVLVYKIDRLTRRVRDLIDLTELFQEHNCTFNSLMESIDTQTASGRMFLKIIGIFAEFERENLIERITVACEKKVKEGYTLSASFSSYGYSREKGDKIQKIVPEEAEIVKEIFDMYIDRNLTQYAIAQNLNHRSIKPKKGKAWNHTSIRNILINPNYVGKVRYSVTDKTKYFEADGKHEAIITQELFDEAQKRMGNIKRKSYTKRPKEDNFFSGTVYCAECDSKMQTHNIYRINKQGEKVSNGQYRCPNILRGLCDSATVSHKKVEEAFESYMDNIEDMSVAENVLSEEQAIKQKQQRDINALLREECTIAINKLEKKEKDIMTLYIKERIAFEEYQQMVKITTNEKNTYINKLTSIPDELTEEIQVTMTDIVTNFRENWKLLTKAEKLQFLQNHIERIIAVSKKEDGYKVKILNVNFHS